MQNPLTSSKSLNISGWGYGRPLQQEEGGGLADRVGHEEAEGGPAHGQGQGSSSPEAGTHYGVVARATASTITPGSLPPYPPPELTCCTAGVQKVVAAIQFSSKTSVILSVIFY